MVSVYKEMTERSVSFTALAPRLLEQCSEGEWPAGNDPGIAPSSRTGDHACAATTLDGSRGIVPREQGSDSDAYSLRKQPRLAVLCRGPLKLLKVDAQTLPSVTTLHGGTEATSSGPMPVRRTQSCRFYLSLTSC